MKILSNKKYNELIDQRDNFETTVKILEATISIRDKVNAELINTILEQYIVHDQELMLNFKAYLESNEKE
jgi:hypothetical protein